jgi:hypothetical protein
VDKKLTLSDLNQKSVVNVSKVEYVIRPDDKKMPSNCKPEVGTGGNYGSKNSVVQKLKFEGAVDSEEEKEISEDEDPIFTKSKPKGHTSGGLERAQIPHEKKISEKVGQNPNLKKNGKFNLDLTKARKS